MRSTALGAGLTVALLALAVVAVGGISADTTATQEETEANASFGANVSSFMQANDVEAEDEVDSGMFNASMKRAETAEERRALVDERTDRLERRQQRLAELRANVSAGGASTADVAMATHVDVGAAALERSANRTDRVARSVGADTERLAAIRQNASELRGQEVAELAQSIAGQPSHAGGPPSEDGAANGTDGPAADPSGNGSDRSTAENGSTSGQDGSDASDGGPPDHAGGAEDEDGDDGADAEADADEQD